MKNKSYKESHNNSRYWNHEDVRRWYADNRSNVIIHSIEDKHYDNGGSEYESDDFYTIVKGEYAC